MGSTTSSSRSTAPTAAGSAPASEASSDGTVARLAGELESRVDLFEQRLWHALLTARFLLPAVILGAIGVGALTGRYPAIMTTVWLVVTIWTALSTPWLWSRLRWARGLPAPFWIEVGALAVLLGLGLGTRQWHMLHFAVPMAFCALLVSPRPTLAICAIFVAAAWSIRLVNAAGIYIPAQQWSGPLTPSVIFVLSAILPMFVPLVFGDARRLARLHRETDGSIRAMRRAEAKRVELVEVLQQAVAPIARVLDGVASEAREMRGAAGAALAGRGERLIAVCEQVETTLAELAQPTDLASGLGSVIAAEIARARRVGWAMRVEGRLERDVMLEGSDVAAFRRLLREALANACTHGTPPATVRLAGDRIEIANRAERAPRPREGHFGLANIEADARAVRAPVAIEHDNVVVRVRIDLSELRDAPAEAARGKVGVLRSLVTRRRTAFERAMRAVQTTVAVFVPISAAYLWTAGTDAQRSVYVPTALVFAACVVAIGMAGSPRRLVAAESAAILAILLLEGGYGGPWPAVAFVAPVPAAFYGGRRVAVLYTGALMVAMLVGAVSITPDAGTLSPVVACLTLAVACACGVAIRWAFDRLGDAAEAYDASMGALLELERRSAALEARADAQREVHNSLLSLIMAASITHAGIARRVPDDPRIDALGERLATASTTVRQLLDSLQARAADVHVTDVPVQIVT